MTLEPYHIYGAVFLAVIVVKEVFVYLKGETRQMAKQVEEIHKYFSNNGSFNTSCSQVKTLFDECVSNKEKVSEMIDSVTDLWEWHNKEDEDGVKVWYVRRTLEKTLKSLSDSIDKQNKVLIVLADKLSYFEEVSKQNQQVKKD